MLHCTIWERLASDKHSSLLGPFVSCESGFKSVDHFLVHFSDGEHVGGQPVGRGLEDHGPALQVPGVLRHGAPGVNVIKRFTAVVYQCS